MFKLRLKIIWLIAFRWIGGLGRSTKEISFICGSNKYHYVVSISKKRIIKQEL